MDTGDRNLGTDEAALIARACSGDQAAFGQLARRYEGPLARFAYRLIGRVDLAEDLRQETLLRAFVSLPHLRDPGRFGAWLFGIAANLARWWWRRHARWPVSIESLAAEYPDVAWERMLPGAPLPEQVVEDAEQTRRLQDAIKALPGDLAHPLVLHYLDGLSYAEIAVALAVPLSTVKGRLYQSRAQLRQALGTDFRAGSGADTRKPHGNRGKKGVSEVSGVESLLVRVVVERVNTPLEEPTVESVVHLLERTTLSVAGEQGRPRPGLTSAAEHVAPLLVHAGVRLKTTSRQILLREAEGARLLPIIVGDVEATGLAVHQQGITVPRPLSYDLMKVLVDTGGVQVTQVTVTRLEETTFYAAITLQQPGGAIVEVDARPSDAINLAARTGAPIFVAAQVLQQAGFTPKPNDQPAVTPE